MCRQDRGESLQKRIPVLVSPVLQIAYASYATQFFDAPASQSTDVMPFAPERMEICLQEYLFLRDTKSRESVQQAR